MTFLTNNSNKFLKHIFSHKVIAEIAFVFIVSYVILYGYFRQELFHFELNWTYLIIVPIIAILDGLRLILEIYFKQDIKAKNCNVDKVSIIIPTYNGEDSLPIVLNDLTKRFPKNNIIVSSNGSTDDTIKIAKNFGVRYIDTPQAIGKEGAIQKAINYVETPYVLTLDDDTIINDANIPVNLLEKGYNAIAFRVLPIKSNWLTTIQSHEYKKSMDIGRGFLNNQAAVNCVSGAIGLFRTDEIKDQSTTHSREFCGEDYQRTMLIHADSDKKGCLAVNSEIFTLAPTNIRELFNQRVFGWNPGFYNNLYLSVKTFFLNPKLTLKYIIFYDIVIMMLGDILRLLSLPIIFFYPYFLVTMYFSYLILETIYWLAIKDREPFWVILVYPFYGLFGFTTRIISAGIFIYRRTVVFISRSKHLDDYKDKSLLLTIPSLVFVLSVFVAVFFSFMLIQDKNFLSDLQEIFNQLSLVTASKN